LYFQAHPHARRRSDVSQRNDPKERHR
jgi:hypothetical protein